MKTLHVAAKLLGASSLLVMSAAMAQSTIGTAPKVTVGPAVASKASSPGPSGTAMNQGQNTVIGKGPTSLNLAEPEMYWTDWVDIDDDANLEDNQFLWDSKRGMLYTYREDDFQCPNGKSEVGSILMGIYTKDNKAKKPVGSGWYVVNLTEGQCNAVKDGTYGCRFDRGGKYTLCGKAVVNERTGDVDVVKTKKL